MRCLDLFSGIGGMALGLERAGIQTAAFCEIDGYARRVLKKHWPHVPCYSDVCQLTKGVLDGDGITGIDIIAGGFPCQDISLEGGGAGLEGARSGLWREYARLIRELQPAYVLVENVAALLVRGIDRVLGDLAACGYDAEWRVFRASEFGLPHQRERVFLVAYPHQVGLEGRVFERAPERVEALSETAFWRDVPEPVVCGGTYGVSVRMGRIGGAGNAVAPLVAEWIGRRIVEHSGG